MLEPRISKRKYQQAGTKANQKLGHKLRPKTVERKIASTSLLFIDQTRTAEIGVHPKYRHGETFISHEAWEKRAAQWDADHDVARPVKPTNRKSRKRDKTPRPAETYRGGRRNVAERPERQVRPHAPSRPWPWPDAGKLAAQARRLRREALAR